VGSLSSAADCERFAADLKVIYYLAHRNTPVDSDLNQVQDAVANLAPLLGLLQAIRRLKSRPHIVYFSSGGAVYGPAESPAPYRETDACAPSTSYGIVKLAAEQYLRLAAARGELTAVALRPGNAYGTVLPEDRAQGLIGVAANRLLHGKPVRVFGNPQNVRDYVHLDDLCAMACLAASPRRAFDIVNVGAGVGHSVLDVLKIVEECSGMEMKLEYDGRCGGFLPNWVVLDTSKARQEYGWSPSISLRTGIQRMLADRSSPVLAGKAVV
jgi:UDP-glucose 4-epimerase